MDTAIRTAYEAANRFTLNDDELYQYLNYDMSVRDNATLASSYQDAWEDGRADGLAEGEAIGIAKGEAKGEAKGIDIGKEDNILRMVKANVSIDNIAIYTGYTEAEVKRVIKRLGAN